MKKRILMSALTLSMLLSQHNTILAGDMRATTVNEGVENIYNIDTLSRGYQIVNEVVYDKYGNILFELTDGLTPDGFALSKDFEVIYPEDMSNEPEKPSRLRRTDIFNSTIYLNKNVNGTEGKQIGSDFKFTSLEKNFYVKYSSGTPSGINVSLNNVTTGSCLKWFSNIQPSKSDTYTGAYNSSRPNDTYRIIASGQGGSGNATILARKQ